MLIYHGLVFPFERRKQQQIIIFNESILLIVIMLAVHLEKTGYDWRDNFNIAFIVIFFFFVFVNLIYILWRFYKIMNDSDGQRDNNRAVGH